jgi:transposase
VHHEERCITLTRTERKHLQHAVRQQERAGEALRATILLWSAQGQSAPCIARILGVPPRTVYRCRRRWRQLGLEGLADSPRPGRPRE